MSEIYMKNNQLISEKAWQKALSKLKTDELTQDHQKAKTILTKVLINAVKTRTEDKNALLFSGGIDSTIIALILKKLSVDFTCFSVGVRNSKDIIAAKKIAEEYGLNLVTKILDLDELESNIKKVLPIITNDFDDEDQVDFIRLSVGTVSYIAMNLAKQHGFPSAFTGLGSEDIFAGYYKYRKSKDTNKDCWQNLLNNMWKSDLKRDCSIALNLNMGVKTPYLDPEVIKTAMAIPGQYKISEGQNKLILRQISLDFGLKEVYAMRKKIAAQYGSGFTKAIQKLARRQGFKYKSKYLKYVATPK